MNGERKPRVALFAAPESSPAILFGLYDVLGSVGAVYPDMTTGEVADTLLDVSIVAADATPFRCFGNVLVEPNAVIDDADRYDVVIVCDLYTPITTPHGSRFTREAAWLGAMHASGSLITSVCTGSLLVAEAGLVDGRTCAGHWAYARPVRYRVSARQVRSCRDPRARHGVGRGDHRRRSDRLAAWPCTSSPASVVASTRSEPRRCTSSPGTRMDSSRTRRWSG